MIVIHTFKKFDDESRTLHVMILHINNNLRREFWAIYICVCDQSFLF